MPRTSSSSVSAHERAIGSGGSAPFVETQHSRGHRRIARSAARRIGVASLGPRFRFEARAIVLGDPCWPLLVSERDNGTRATLRQLCSLIPR